MRPEVLQAQILLGEALADGSNDPCAHDAKASSGQLADLLQALDFQ